MGEMSENDEEEQRPTAMIARVGAVAMAGNAAWGVSPAGTSADLIRPSKTRQLDPGTGETVPGKKIADLSSIHPFCVADAARHRSGGAPQKHRKIWRVCRRTSTSNRSNSVTHRLRCRQN